MRAYVEPHEYSKFAQLGSALDVYEDKKRYPGTNTSLRMLLVRLKEDGLFDDVLTEARRNVKDSVTICIKRNLKARLEKHRLELLNAPLGTYAIATFKLETKYHDLRTRTWPCYMTTDYVLVRDPQVFIDAYRRQLPQIKSGDTLQAPDAELPSVSMQNRRSDPPEPRPDLREEPAGDLLHSLQSALHEEREARKAQDERIKFLESELKRAFTRIDSERAALENFLEQTEHRLKERKL